MSRSVHVARLYPDSGQAAKLDAQAHAARGLWNLLHEWHLRCREHRRPRLAFAEVDRQMRAARLDPPDGYEWLALLPAQASQQVLKYYQRAWQHFYDGVTRPPVFKVRSRARMAVDIPQAAKLKVVRLSRRWGVVSVPMIGRVRFRWTRALPGVSRGITGRLTGAHLVREANGWHVIFRIETPDVAIPVNHRPAVGIDRGITRTMALSDGTFHDMPDLLSVGEARRLLRLERKAARQKRVQLTAKSRSNRRQTTYDQIAKVRARTKRRRNDWIHKATTDISRTYGTVVVEILLIENMVRSAKGTVDKPGRHVRQKTGLNRRILNAGWGRIGNYLAYKTAREGARVIKVPAPGTSRRCHVCGHVDKASRLTQARFVCTKCGWAGNADTNASKNIVYAARLSCTDVEISGLPGTVKRQPPDLAA